MSWLLIFLIIVAIAALLIFLFRKRIKAYVMSKLMAYASKKMMEAMTGDLLNVFDEVKKK